MRRVDAIVVLVFPAIACVWAVLAQAGEVNLAALPPVVASMDMWQGIKEVGFPAVAFVALFWLVRSTLRDNTQALHDLTEAVSELRGYLKRAVGDEKR